MKVINISDLPKFDVKFNSRFNLINETLISPGDAAGIQSVEIKSASDWQIVQSLNEIAEVTIWNIENNEFDELIDFENKDLCEKVEYLTIYGAIEKISDKICRLSNLKRLCIYDVSFISPSISRLSKLEELALLDCNQLEYIPFEIFEIQSLKKLTINGLDYYENFSPRINRLINLEWLTLKDHYPFLSEEITQLYKLRCLDIERPHACVYDIPSLEVLHVRVFQSGLLSGIKKLKKLKELWLDIRECNEEINELSSLKHLIIYNFSGTSLPNLDRLHNLELLVISECSNLNSVPDFIFNLPNLKYLGLRGLNNLKAIPTEINNIPGLQYLELMKAEDAGFYELPEFRSGLFVHKMVSWNSYERIN